MIYTITMNPSIDYIVTIDQIKLGHTNRSQKETTYPGGKGINVSRVLNNLNTKSVALGFVGGFTGQYIIDFLEKEKIDSDFVKIDQDTRINIKIKGQTETEINASGPVIKQDQLEDLLKKIQDIGSNDYLVLAGNVQSSIPFDIYSKIQKICNQNQVKVIVDTSGEALKESIKQRPFLIKPNIHELEELLDVRIKSQEDIFLHVNELLKLGIQNVIVSMAEKGAYLMTKDEIYYANAPNGQVQNSVGAGDSMIAGFLYAYQKGENIATSFRYAAASGSATAFSMDLCKKEKVEELYKQIHVRKLK